MRVVVVGFVVVVVVVSLVLSVCGCVTDFLAGIVWLFLMLVFF